MCHELIERASTEELVSTLGLLGDFSTPEMIQVFSPGSTVNRNAEKHDEDDTPVSVAAAEIGTLSNSVNGLVSGELAYTEESAALDAKLLDEYGF